MLQNKGHGQLEVKIPSISEKTYSSKMEKQIEKED